MKQHTWILFLGAMLCLGIAASIGVELYTPPLKVLLPSPGTIVGRPFHGDDFREPLSPKECVFATLQRAEDRIEREGGGEVILAPYMNRMDFHAPCPKELSAGSLLAYRHVHIRLIGSTQQ